MGYCTQFNIEVTGFKNKEEAEFFEFKLIKLSNYNFSCSTYDGVLSLETDDIKWYDWKKNLTDISKIFPHVLIEVEGTGEENGDNWKARVRNGRVEIIEPQIVWPEFKEIF